MFTRIPRIPLRSGVVLLALAFHGAFAAADSDLGAALRSVIRIQSTTMQPDLKVPWNVGRVQGGTGSGFVIAGNMVMTNAHVVSNARFLGLQRPDSPQIVPATVKYIAHDCDLAVLQVEDPTFFAGLVPLEFGDVPSLHTTVTTIGYPIGGQRMSITRGVVSRIEYRSYVHSGLDSHLAIQTDAAINPGNSGGPVVQDGKVVGVAFQGIGGGQAQNTGYMIPTPVIQRFLADIQDGRYDGYPELAIGTFNLVNQTVREKLGLPMDSSGLLVTHVQPEGSADGFLKDGDVLMKVDGHPIMSDGQIDLDGERILMVEIVERKFIGDTVVFTVLRDGKTKDVEVPLKGAQFYMYRAHEYDALPRYLVFAGLVFQPLTLDFLQRYQPTEPAVLDAYEFQISDGVYVERPEIVVLSQILADPINTYMGGFQMSVVEEVNGRTIGSMKDLDEALSAPAERYVIKVRGEGVPLVLEADKVAAAQERIAKQYGIPQNKNIGKGTREE